MDVSQRLRTVLISAVAVLAASNATLAGDPHERQTTSGVVEFEIAKGGDVIILPVAIGNKQFPFAIGIANDRTVVDERLHPFLGAPLARRENARTSAAIKEVPPIAMKIGNEMFKPPKPLPCGDMADFCEQYGHDVYGVIGLDFLKDRIFQIDFDRGMFRILSSIDELDISADGMACIPLYARELDPNSCSIFLELSGQLHSFVVDTLFTRSLAMEPASIGRLLRAGAVKELQETSFFIEPGRRFWMREGVLDSVSFAYWNQRRISVVQQERNRVGLAYLSRFQLTFDIKERSLYVVPGARINAPDSFRTQSGVELVLKNRDVTTLCVFPEQRAAKAGVRPGDVILEVDGVPSGKLSLFEIEKQLASQNCVHVKFRRPSVDGHPPSEHTVDLEELAPSTVHPRQRGNEPEGNENPVKDKPGNSATASPAGRIR